MHNFSLWPPPRTEPMERYRITCTPPDGPEQTWVLLPDRPSAEMQAHELRQRKKGVRVRVYHEVPGRPRVELEAGDG
jgi:hypothetical protein